MPAFPRIPGLPDPLRRIHVPRDLAAVTTIAPEADPAAAGMTREGVEQIWDDVVSLYRSGMHPAIQVCVRREGEVVLDRSIGHARATGPRTASDAERVLADPRHALLRVLGVEGGHGVRRAQADRARPRRARHAGGRVHPGLRHPRQGRHHDRPRARASRRRAEPPRRGARHREHRRPRAARQGALRRAPVRQARPAARLPRSLGRVHPRRGRPPGHGQGHPRPCSPRSSSIRWAFAGRTTASPRRTSRRSASTTSPARRCCRRFGQLLTRALGASARDRDAGRQRARLPHRHRAGGQHGHDRERALALLRGDAPRRRARRRARDRARDDPHAR